MTVVTTIRTPNKYTLDETGNEYGTQKDTRERVAPQNQHDCSRTGATRTNAHARATTATVVTVHARKTEWTRSAVLVPAARTPRRIGVGRLAVFDSSKLAVRARPGGGEAVHSSA